MQEHLGTILAAIIAGFGGIGALLLWLIRYFAEGKAKAEERTITVLKESAAEARLREAEWGQTLKNLIESGEKLARAVDASAKTDEAVGKALEQLNARFDAALLELRLKGLMSTSGQQRAVRREKETP